MALRLFRASAYKGALRTGWAPPNRTLFLGALPSSPVAAVCTASGREVTPRGNPEGEALAVTVTAAVLTHFPSLKCGQEP